MPGKEIQTWHISTGTFLKFFAIILGLILIYAIRDLVFSFFFAIIIASAMEPALERLKQWRIPRIVGVIMIYLVIAFLIFFIIYFIFPVLFEEFNGFARLYPVIQDQIISGIEKFEITPFSTLFSENVEKLLELPANFFLNASEGFLDFASYVFGSLFSFFLIVVFSFYLAIQEKGIESFLKLITPLSYESYVLDLWQRSQKKLGRWFRSQILLGVLVGVLIFIGLTILRVRNALFLAIIAGVFELIPVAGPILAAIPAVLIAFLNSPLLGLAVVILYIVVQQFESNIVVPVVMRQAVGLSPLIVVLAILIGAKIGGFFGILLAVPITTVLAELLSDWDKKKRELIPL